MTNYETMTDAELNKAVAEALGWTHVHDAPVPCGVLSWGLKPDDTSTTGCPNWSTDVGAAMWLLEDWVNAEPDTVTWDIHALYPGSGDTPHVECRLCPLWDESKEIIGVGDTVMQAICIAFLKARQQKEGGR